MRQRLQRFFAFSCMAIATASVFIGASLLNGSLHVKANTGNKYKLEFSEDLQAKTSGISYDVNFSYNVSGWLANRTPTTEDITMSWKGVTQTSGPRAQGVFHGFARSATATDPYFLFFSEDGFGAVGYNGAYSWEGCSDTFTMPGVTTAITYSKQHIAEQYEAKQQTPNAYIPPQILMNGAYMDLAEYPYAPTGFKGADDAGANYLALQWLAEDNGNNVYAASLTDVQLYNASGYDLGIQFSTGTLGKAGESVSSSVQRYGLAGSTITVNPDEKVGYDFVGLKAVSNGASSKLTLTDNGDGTYSFVMPEQDVRVEAEYTKVFHTLDIVGGSTNKINGVSYDVEFSFDSEGWFANGIPTTEDITMTWTGVSQTYEERVAGEIYGIARSVSAKNGLNIFFSDSYGAIGYRGSHNGGVETYTMPQKTTTISYSKALVAEKVANGQLPEVYIDGAALEFAQYPYAPTDFKGADDAGARYLAIQWLGAGKQYDASLTGLRIYNASGDDLGIMFSQTALSASVQRYGKAGETISVKPEHKDGFAFKGWKATDKNGEAIDISFTNNGDGTYSFTMPQNELVLTAEYENVRYALNLDGARTTKIDGVSYDVDFRFEGGGWFGNEIPTAEDITMTWNGVSQTRTGSEITGYVYGIVRSASATDRQYLFNSESTAGYGFTFNGSNQTYTEPGVRTTIEYSKNLVASGTQNLYYNGSDKIFEFHSYMGSSWAAADKANAQYLAVQWIEGFYEASLSNVKIYNKSGDDLGFAFGEYKLTNSFVQRFAEKGKTITITANVPEYYALDYWTITDANGEPYDLELTDNGDGTYSFTMPEQALTIKANFKYQVVLEKYYGYYYCSVTGELVQLKENGVAVINVGGQRKTVSYEIPQTTLLKLNDGETTKEYVLAIGKFEIAGEKVYSKLGSYYVTFDTHSDTVIARQELKDGNYKAVKPENPVKAGYEFVGWYTSDGVEYNFDAIVCESVTLHAKWALKNAPVQSSGCGAIVSGLGVLVVAVGACAILLSRRMKNKGENLDD